MDFVKKGQNYFLATLLISMLFLPMLATAATMDEVGASLVKLLGLPDSIKLGGTSAIIFFVIVPLILMFIIVYGILDEIHLFYKSSINFAIAVLSVAMMIPTNVIGQMIIGIYGGGMSTLVIIVGISILPRFLDKFGPRTGLPPVILELLTAATYGLMMFFVFGFMTEKGGMLANMTWIRWVFTLGVPLLVLFRGLLQRNMSYRVGNEMNVMKQEELMRQRSQTGCIRALEILASQKTPGTPDKLPTVSDDAYLETLNRTVDVCAGRLKESELRAATDKMLKKLAGDVRKETYPHV